MFEQREYDSRDNTWQFKRARMDVSVMRDDAWKVLEASTSVVFQGKVSISPFSVYNSKFQKEKPRGYHIQPSKESA